MSEPTYNIIPILVTEATKYAPLLNTVILGGIGWMVSKFNKIESHLSQINGTVKSHTVQIEEIHRSGDQCRENMNQRFTDLRVGMQHIRKGED